LVRKVTTIKRKGKKSKVIQKGRNLNAKIQKANNKHTILQYASIEDTSSNKGHNNTGHTLHVATTEETER